VRENIAGVVYDPGGHVVAGMLFLPAAAVAFIVLSQRLARDPRWYPLAGNTSPLVSSVSSSCWPPSRWSSPTLGRCPMSAGWCNA
jgi:hypothetical protein